MDHHTAELHQRNQFKTHVHVRPPLYAASEEIGVRLHDLQHSFFIYATPFGKYVEVEAGIRCVVSSWRRVPDQSLPARAKITGSYAQSAPAQSQATQSRFDQGIVLPLRGPP